MSRILIATPELAEVAPVGGIAEYVLGLATALLKNGHDVRVVLPLYGYLRNHPNLSLVKERVVIRMGVGNTEVTSVYKLDLKCPGENGPTLPVILLGNHKHFATVRNAGDVYSWPNHEPWIAFSRGVVDWLLNEKDWQPDIVHCQDSHASLIPVYVQELRSSNTFASRVRTVLTIHNLLNQGEGPRELVPFAGLPIERYDDIFEYFGHTNCFKAGLLTADVANTVSHTYAQEICETPEFGFGLEGVLRTLRDAGKLRGIVNGIDENRWVMPGLRYDGSDSTEMVLKAKKDEREKHFSQWGWQAADEPVIAFRGRWDTQKGVKLLVEAIPSISEIARIIIVTWPTPGSTEELQTLWQELIGFATEHPQRILLNKDGVKGIDETKNHYAIADFFLMPSGYEPCGLTQQECQRFGTIPIVRRTGGLADTVAENQTYDLPSPNGYIFHEMNSDAMIAAIRRAVDDFRNVERRDSLIGNTLLQRNSWESRLPQYENLYGIGIQHA